MRPALSSVAWRLGPGTGCFVFLLEATSCTATFAETAPLTVTKTGAGSPGLLITSMPPGIICAGACTVATGAFDAGTEVQLATNTLPAGFAFLGWTGDGCVNGPGSGEARVLMDRERACTATSRLVAAKQAPATGTSWLRADLTLSWSGATPEVGFWVCVDQTNNQVCDTLWRPNGGATSMELGWMGLGPGTYYWQVRSQDDQTGTFTDYDGGVWWRFTIGSGSQAAVALGGDGGPAEWRRPSLLCPGRRRRSSGRARSPSARGNGVKRTSRLNLSPRPRRRQASTPRPGADRGRGRLT